MTNDLLRTNSESVEWNAELSYINFLIEQRKEFVRNDVEELITLSNRTKIIGFIEDQFHQMLSILEEYDDPNSDILVIAKFSFNHFLKSLIANDYLREILFSGKDQTDINVMRIKIIQDFNDFIDSDVILQLIENTVFKNEKKPKNIDWKDEIVEKYYDDEDIDDVDDSDAYKS